MPNLHDKVKSQKKKNMTAIMNKASSLILPHNISPSHCVKESLDSRGVSVRGFGQFFIFFRIS